MRCPNCNSEIGNDYNVCPFCSRKLVTKIEDKPSFWWGVVVFFAPIIGIVFYLGFSNDRPKLSRLCIKSAIIGFIFYFICAIIFTIILIIKIRYEIYY